MKLTKNDIEMFKGLSKSQLGKDLVDYLERLESHVHDSRSWSGDDSKESAAQAAKIIKTHLRQKLVPQKGNVKITPFD